MILFCAIEGAVWDLVSGSMQMIEVWDRASVLDTFVAIVLN